VHDVYLDRRVVQQDRRASTGVDRLVTGAPLSGMATSAPLVTVQVAVIVRLKVAVATTGLSGVRTVPLTTMWNTPPGLVFAVANVSVDVAPASGEGGENDAVTPAGRPLALSSTGWSATPRLAVNETVVVVLAPVTTVADDGLRCSERVDG